MKKRRLICWDPVLTFLLSFVITLLAFLLSFVITLGVFLCAHWDAEQAAREQEPEVNSVCSTSDAPITVQAAPAAAVVPDEYPEYPEDPEEEQKITAALLEQGYYRDDVPLSYELQDLLQTACDEFNVDYPLALAIIEHETGFRNVMGDGGDSAGYMQIQAKWWSWLMAEIGAYDLTRPYDNFRTGCAIIDYLTEIHGNVEAAVVAYNLGHYDGELTNYAREVLARAEDWRKQ